MFCPKCGATVENGTRFCSECGTDVLAAQAAPTGNAAQPQYARNTYGTPPPPPAPPQPRPQYGYPQYPQPVNPNDAPLSVGQFILTMIVFAIPLVGFIMMLVWAFSSDVNKNRKNYSRAALILWVIGVVISIVLLIVAGAAIAAIWRSIGGSYNYNYNYNW
jgi:predicted nucleic acid-binding Zn ribbon protein